MTHPKREKIACPLAKTRVLTYRQGQFVFTTAGVEKVIPLKTANAYSLYADGKAARVLQRAFVKHYPLAKKSLPSFLDPHQKDGVKWILTRSRSYLAHAPGAGKTCQAIVAALRTPGEGRIVFIVPPSLTVNWKREINNFAHTNLWRWQDPISILPSTERQNEMNWLAEFIIVPDSMLTKPWVIKKLNALPIKFLAVDEASRFKEAGSQRTIALFGGKLKDGTQMPGLVYRPKHSVLLDGSPMPNRTMELWAPTYAMSPESINFMSQEDFGFKYCGPKMNPRGHWEFKYSSNEAELKERLQKDFMHVVPESALSHPERRRSILVMTEDARSPAHRAWEQTNPINVPRIDESASQGSLATYRRELGLRKVKWIASYVRNRLENTHESILLFAWHREVCLGLQKELSAWTPGLVMGGTSDVTREKEFELFQSGRIRLVIGNISAMGRGFNLQRADRVIFGEYSWCGETNVQCEKRASRKGSDKEFVRCEYIVSPNSMDEIILNAIFRKEKTLNRVMG